MANTLCGLQGNRRVCTAFTAGSSYGNIDSVSGVVCLRPAGALAYGPHETAV